MQWESRSPEGFSVEPRTMWQAFSGDPCGEVFQVRERLCKGSEGGVGSRARPGGLCQDLTSGLGRCPPSFYPLGFGW